MSAGQSAYDVARRQRETAERLQRSAAKWEQGAAGEVEVARMLAGLPVGWVVLHDLAWPGRPKANIDHVVIGPGGIFVVDAKNWTGRVEVRDEVLRQNGRARERAVVSAAEAAIAVQRVLPTSHLCTGVLCFVREEPMTGWARDVMVCTTANLLAMLTSRPPVLEVAAIDRCARVARSRMSSRSPVRTTPVRSTPVRSTPVRSTPVVRRSGAGGVSSSDGTRRAPWLKVAAAVVFVALALGGGLAELGQWAGDKLVDEIAPAQPSGPAEMPLPVVETPTKKDGARRDNAGRQG